MDRHVAAPKLTRTRKGRRIEDQRVGQAGDDRTDERRGPPARPARAIEGDNRKKSGRKERDDEHRNLANARRDQRAAKLAHQSGAEHDHAPADRKRNHDLREGIVGPITPVRQVNGEKRRRQNEVTDSQPTPMRIGKVGKRPVHVEVDRRKRDAQKKNRKDCPCGGIERFAEAPAHAFAVAVALRGPGGIRSAAQSVRPVGYTHSLASGRVRAVGKCS